MEDSLQETKEVRKFAFCLLFPILTNCWFAFLMFSIVPPKVKNIEKSSKGDKVARIHMKKQNLDAFGGRRVTALRGAKRPRDGDNTSEKSNKKSKA